MRKIYFAAPFKNNFLLNISVIIPAFKLMNRSCLNFKLVCLYRNVIINSTNIQTRISLFCFNNLYKKKFTSIQVFIYTEFTIFEVMDVLVSKGTTVKTFELPAQYLVISSPWENVSTFWQYLWLKLNKNLPNLSLPDKSQ